MNAELRAGSPLGAAVGEDGDAAARSREATVALRKTPTPDETRAWAELVDRARSTTASLLRSGGVLGRVDSGETRAGFDHEVDAPRVMRSWRLDHVVYSPKTLRASTRWRALESRPELLASGLPSGAWASDHFPVAAAFHFAPSDAAAVALTRADAAAFGAVLAAEARSLIDAAKADADAAASAPAPAPAPAAGSKKAKKAKPTPGEAALLKAKRARKKALAKETAERRRAFVDGLAPGAYDALEAALLDDVEDDPLGAWCSGAADGADAAKTNALRAAFAAAFDDA